MAALVILFGGGGAEGSNLNAIIAAAGAFALAAAFLAPSPSGLNFSQKWLPLFIGVGCLALPLLQLVPLPPETWHNLAGRQPIAETLGFVGAAGQWRPLSLAPDATLRAATFMLFPLAAFFAALKGTSSFHKNVVILLALCAAASGMIGAAQLALGHPDWLSFYDGASFGAASGIFANPNHEALFMVFGLVASAIIVRESSIPKTGVGRRTATTPVALAAWVGLLFFSIMTLASGARAGVMLLIVALPGSLIIALGKNSLLRWAGLLVGLLALIWVFVLLYPGTNSLGIRESFRFGEDARYAYLPDILYTLEKYWRAGSGLGSFVPVFTPNESLELAGRAYLNHAHNDFLEWTLEAGLPGVVWIALSILAVGFLALPRLKSRSADIGLTMGALLLVTLTGIHSLADYPLRTATVATVFAFAVGLLCSKPVGSPVKCSEVQAIRPRPRWLVVTVLTLATPIAFVALKAHLLEYALRSGDFMTAARLNPDSPRVLVQRSEVALRDRQVGVAEGLAARAVMLDPLLVPALRQLALAREARNSNATAIWQAASSLGWRDAPTQIWALRQALLGEEWDTAAMRAGALLRTQPPDPKMLSYIRVVAQKPAFASELANRIRLGAPWRAAFFALPAKPTPADIAGITQVLIQLAKSQDSQRGDAKSLISYFLSKKEWSDALAVNGYIPTAGGDNAVLTDGGFNRTVDAYVKDSTPFDWQTLKGSHLSAQIETFPPSRLVLDSDGESQAIGAQRYLVVHPGLFTLSFVSRADNADSFRVRILCASSSKVLASGLIDKSTSFRPQTVNFDFPVGCPLAQLVVESLPGGVPATAEFDNFEIAPR